MIALDDLRWGQLNHAYHDAADIPALLRQLEASSDPAGDYRDEPWFSLWSSLCHQGTIYTASYAAVPHLIRIAIEAEGPVDFSFFQLPVLVEVARRSGHGPEIPEDLAGDYHHALSRLGESVFRHWNETWDRGTLLSAMAALALVKGDIEFAEALTNLDGQWIASISRCELDYGKWPDDGPDS